jgi:DNA-binding HxlR family transcriptional regulator
MSSNLEALEAAGVIVKTPLPDAYAEVLNDLTEEEVEIIVSVKQRLDQAGESAGRTPSETLTNYIVI